LNEGRRKADFVLTADSNFQLNDKTEFWPATWRANIQTPNKSRKTSEDDITKKTALAKPENR
jgi:hypothetical protein